MEKILTKATLIEGKIQPKGTKIVIEEMVSSLPRDGDKIRVTKDFNIYDTGYNDIVSLRAGDPYEIVDLGTDEIYLKDFQTQIAVKKVDLLKFLDNLYLYPVEESVENKEVAPKLEEGFNSNADVENLAYEVQDLTDRNNHTEARIMVAEEFGMTKYQAIFTKIGEIRDIDGGLAMDLSSYQYNLTNEMLEIIEKLAGKDARDTIYNAM